MILHETLLKATFDLRDLSEILRINLTEMRRTITPANH